MKFFNFRIIVRTTLFSILVFIAFSGISYFKTKENAYDYKLYAPLRYYQQFSLDHNQSITNWGWDTSNLILDLIIIWTLILIFQLSIQKKWW